MPSTPNLPPEDLGRELLADKVTGNVAGKVAVVAGGTRGAGRAIAIELGRVGCTVYVTGRSTRSARSDMDRPETIEETAELVRASGGQAVAMRVDHADVDDVRTLAAAIEKDAGRVDILVNDVWGGDPLVDWSVRFWEHDLEKGLRALRQGTETHLLTTAVLAPLLLAAGRALVVEVTDGVDDDYRGNLFYDLAKSQVIRLARGEAAEFAGRGVTVVALTPGFLRSEAMLDHFGVTADTWRDAIAIDPHFVASETPHYVARAVAALAIDPNVEQWHGRALSSWQLAQEYGFADVDGSRPDWGRYFDEHVAPQLERPGAPE
jgi:NAD(P)-dependent dehydrogenase (short-subunit alcohol dehydrogenase family)